MKAVVVHRAGDLRVDALAEPVAGAGEVLVDVEWGGICGSDLSYVAHGISGTAVLTSPMVLGHEIAGRVSSVGDDVDPSLIGQPVAIYPPTLVGDDALPHRLAGRTNLHPSVRYYGSAGLHPHTDGGFVERKAVRLEQLICLPAGVDTRRGAVAEPAAVALHAIHRAGDLIEGGVRGRDILVNGCGPIGLLVVAIATHLGARSVTAADVSDQALTLARSVGATRTVNVASDPIGAEFELSIEASGAPAALGTVLRATARGGAIVQVGNLPAAEVSAVLGDLITREIVWGGSYRFVKEEMVEAVQLLADGLDVTPILTHEFPVDDAGAAFAKAADRSSGASKVLLSFAS